MKSKDTYSVFSNLMFNMKAAKQWDPKLLYYQFLPVLPGVLATYLGLLIPAELVRGLEEHWALERLLLYMVVLSCSMLVCNLLDTEMSEYIYRNATGFTMFYEKLCYKKIMDLDYHLLQQPECAGLIANTWSVLRNEHGIRTAVSVTPALLRSILSVAWYGLKISRNSIGIVVLAVTHTVLNLWLIRWLRHRQEKYQKGVGKYAKQTAYISRQAMSRQAGKEIRLYQMQDWFLKRYDEAVDGMNHIYRKIHDGRFYKVVMDAFVLFILNCFAYLYLIHLFGQGEIRTSDFVLYIGLIGSFSEALKLLLEHVLSLNSIHLSIGYIRSFLDLQEEVIWSEGVGEEVMQKIRQEGVCIELKNVSYRYPKETENTLKQLQLTIASGEHLALIGLNGAGKTTLVKLLCGFFRPTEGEILINQIPIDRFSRKQYMELVTVLFQDAALLPMSLDRNLTGEDTGEIDRKRLQRALRLSGFWEKYEKLPEKGETLLVREANQEALDFSGGEKQKLLFARALYKEAPVMILDEPTAALDPIAENQMYENFSEAAGKRTCVYISHRLSSTRFCDRILLLENGQITEEGTHTELMERKGQYAKLYEVQSKYYREQAAGENGYEQAGLD